MLASPIQSSDPWLALPTSLRSLLAPVLAPETDVLAAEKATSVLAHHHYENFSVISLLLPRHLRQDFCNIYAFCRVADDLGDETGNTDQSRADSLEMLDEFKRQTHGCYAGDPGSALFTALRHTVKRHDIPIEPFLDLIDAFEQDQRVRRFDTFAQVVDYCRRSADPVGRLVLYLCGYSDEQRQRLSDRTCTALQLVNFWQDVRRDLIERDRIYLPRESLEKFGVTEDQLRRQIHEGKCDENYRNLIQFECDRVAKIFDEGDALLPLLRPDVRRQIKLFASGGRAVLRAIVGQNFDTITRRPKVSKWQKARLIGSSLVKRDNTPVNDWMQHSYDYCRHITRTQARNFYYGLKLLPEPRRSAMFAIYAFMRLTDDIADDSAAGPLQDRLAALESWRRQTHAAIAGQPSAGDIWPAFSQTVRRYRVPTLVFDEVIAGQEQDLASPVFESFEQLETYCYRVAGVVGLASIYIWGFEGGDATEILALHRGTAFQLTNILRDLREDLQRGRVYLPGEDLRKFNLTIDDLRNGTGQFESFMRFQIERAESYYARSAALESFIERDSRPTLVAMTRIYHGLLGKIARAPRRALVRRVSLSVPAKIAIAWSAVRAGKMQA